MDENTVKSIIDTLYRQLFVVNAISEALGSVITILHKTMKKCDEEDCSGCATFLKEERAVCDRHFALMFSEDHGWSQVDNVESVRILQDYVDTKKTLEPSETIH